MGKTSFNSSLTIGERELELEFVVVLELDIWFEEEEVELVEDDEDKLEGRLELDIFDPLDDELVVVHPPRMTVKNNKERKRFLDTR